MSLAETVDALCDGFHGVVSISRGADVEFERGYGFSDRAHRIPATPDTMFGIASGTKAFTAVTVLALIDDGLLAPGTRARSLLGDDLPLIADEVTVEQLLTHRSGIGDYVDEDEPEPAPLKVPVQDLATTEDYLLALDGFPAKFAPGARFSYSNSGYVVLALLAERVTGRPFHDVVAKRVLAPAGMSDTAFLRSDELPGHAAIGYLDDGRTNVFSLPVRGSGDGGAYSTVGDVRRFWTALFSGWLLGADGVRRMTEPQVAETGHPFSYGIGVWLHPDGSAVLLDGCDLGVSFRSVYQHATGRVTTVVGNTTEGAFPIARALRERLI